jgi:CBS domain containing-hemolysin-like protein
MGWVALFLFVALSAFGAAAQEAINPINQARMQRLENDGMPRAKAVEKLITQSDVLASALLLLATFATAGAAVAAAGLAFFVFHADAVAVVGLALLLIAGLYFAQVAGRALALRDPRTTAETLERPVSMVERGLAPVARLFTAVADRLMGGNALKSVRASTGFNADALYLLLNSEDEQEAGSIDEQAMIHRIVGLEDKTAHEVMVPRIDVVGIEADATISQVIDMAEENNYSRMPVYEESLDNIVGVLYVKDLLPLLRNGTPQSTARDIARPAYFIPESKHVDELLQELRHNKVHFAVVVDEYGGTAGVVTIEDVLEEIVGEIQDEYDMEEERFEVVNEREAVLDAAITVDEANRALGLALETDGYDTLGGLVYHQLGKVPEGGDSFRVGDLMFTVLSTDGRRIEKIRLERVAPEPGEGESDESAPSWQQPGTPVRSG